MSDYVSEKEINRTFGDALYEQKRNRYLAGKLKKPKKSAKENEDEIEKLDKEHKIMSMSVS